MTRVLILTASVGEGHDLPARVLAEQLRAEDADCEVVVEDGLRAMGRGFVLVNERAPGVVFFRFRWLWDAAFWLFVGLAPTRRATQAFVRRLGSRGVLQARRGGRPRRRRLRLPDDDRSARRAAPAGTAADTRGRRDHRPRDDALLGGAGNRPSSDHAPGVGRRGARGSRARRRRAGGARPDAPGVRRAVRSRRGEARPRAPARGEDRARLRRRLGRRRPRERGRRGARARRTSRSSPCSPDGTTS